MKTTTTSVLALASVLGYLLISAPAGKAAGGDPRLNGSYGIAGSGACLTAPGGFAANLTPLDPALSYSGSFAISGVFKFDGNGAGTARFFQVGITPPPVPVGFAPGAGSTELSGSISYQVASGGLLTITGTNLAANNGVSGVLDVFTIDGVVSTDNKGVMLGTAQPYVETFTFSNGAVLPSLCHLSLVLLKISK